MLLSHCNIIIHPYKCQKSINRNEKHLNNIQYICWLTITRYQHHQSVGRSGREESERQISITTVIGVYFGTRMRNHSIGNYLDTNKTGRSVYNIFHTKNESISRRITILETNQELTPYF